jgi:hypothetical protein
LLWRIDAMTKTKMLLAGVAASLLLAHHDRAA